MQTLAQQAHAARVTVPVYMRRTVECLRQQAYLAECSRDFASMLDYVQQIDALWSQYVAEHAHAQ